MTIELRDLHREHPLVQASKDMVKAHENNDTLVPALEEMSEKYPELSEDYLILLWLGVNSKYIADAMVEPK